MVLSICHHIWCQFHRGWKIVHLLQTMSSRLADRLKPDPTAAWLDRTVSQFMVAILHHQLHARTWISRPLDFILRRFDEPRLMDIVGFFPVSTAALPRKRAIAIDLAGLTMKLPSYDWSASPTSLMHECTHPRSFAPPRPSSTIILPRHRLVWSNGRREILDHAKNWIFAFKYVARNIFDPFVECYARHWHTVQSRLIVFSFNHEEF